MAMITNTRVPVDLFEKPAQKDLRRYFLYEVHTVKDGDVFLAAANFTDLDDKIHRWLQIGPEDYLERVIFVKQLGEVKV